MKNYEKINSISNKIHSLENNTIISFNLDRDSLFDIYLEIDDNREINLLEEGYPKIAVNEYLLNMLHICQ